MTTFLTILYMLVCVFLILVVLLQAGRGGGMGSAFGGSSQTVFGGAGAGNFLTRLTVIMAATFMILSATLAYLSSSSDKALEKAAQAVQAREKARKLGPDAKGSTKSGATAPATDLTSNPGATPAAPGAPIELEAPVEGAPEEMPAEGAAPHEGAAAPAAPAAPAPAAPSGAAPSAPAVPAGEGAPAAPAAP